MRKKVCGILKICLVVFLIFLLFSGLVLPAFHRSTGFPEKILTQGLPRDLGKQANERVLCIDDNREALVWRLRVIEQAREELIFTTYSYRDDEGGRDVMAALLSAARRGVRVRMLVDGISGVKDLKQSKAFRALAAEKNVHVRFYNPVNLLTPWRLNYRMHDKYLVADQTVYILGGRNTKNLSLGDYQPRRDYDRDLLVYSPTADSRNSLHQVRDYFETIWSLPACRDFTGKSGEAETRALLEHYELLQGQYPEAFVPTDWQEATLPTGGVSLLHNSPEPENKAPVVWDSLMELMAREKTSIVQTPYLICGGKMYRDLADLTEKNCQVKIILNHVQSGANPWGSTDYLNEKGHIRKTGAELYEFQGEHSSHAKTVIIGDRLSVVGSFNFDMRSAYLDTEMMLVIDSPELNAHLRELAEKNIASSRQVLPDGTQRPGDAYPARPLEIGKWILYRILQLIMPCVRHIM